MKLESNNEMDDADQVSCSLEIQKIIKSMYSYLDAYLNGEMNY